MKKFFLILTALSMLFTAACASGEAPGTSGSDPDISDRSREEPELSSDENIFSSIDADLNVFYEDIPDAGLFIDEKELISAHRNEFDRIIALGEDALPYLDELIDDLEKNKAEMDGMINIIKRNFITHIKYAIKPELYDLVFPSPDGKYVVKISIDTFMAVGILAHDIFYKDAVLIDAASDSVLSVFNINDNYAEIKWSPDSRYAAISYGFPRYYYKTDVIDALNADLIKLPGSEDIEAIIREELEYFIFRNEFGTDCFFFEEWQEPDIIKIEITPRTIVTGWFISSGWYTYDLAGRQIVGFEYTVNDAE